MENIKHESVLTDTGWKHFLLDNEWSKRDLSAEVFNGTCLEVLPIRMRLEKAFPNRHPNKWRATVQFGEIQIKLYRSRKPQAKAAIEDKVLSLLRSKNKCRT